MANVSQAGTTPASATTGIQTLPAKSSFLSGFEYDQANLRLTVFFKSGGIYQHSFYLPLAWQQLQQAQDHSKHYANSIKGKYAGSRIKDANKGPKNALPKPLDYKIVDKKPKKKV